MKTRQQCYFAPGFSTFNAGEINPRVCKPPNLWYVFITVLTDDALPTLKTCRHSQATKMFIIQRLILK